MLKIFISGPYRGETPNDIHKNISVAREYAVSLWEKGYAVFCPHLNTAFMDGVCPDENFLKGDLLFLKKCDYIFMLPGWKNSVGAIAERNYALKHKIRTWYAEGDRIPYSW